MAVLGAGATAPSLPVPVRVAQPPDKRHRRARGRMVVLLRLISTPSVGSLPPA
jgi:hypothetical protein